MSNIQLKILRCFPKVKLLCPKPSVVCRLGNATLTSWWVGGDGDKENKLRCISESPKNRKKSLSVDDGI